MAADRAHKWTDQQLAQLEERIRREYSQALKEMQAKQKKAMREYSRERSERLKALDDTKEAKAEYEGWLKDQSVRNEYINAMVGQLSTDATMASEKAIATVNDYLPGIYSENANWAAFSVDKEIGMDTMFTLVDEDTVRNLLKNDPKLYPSPSLDIPKNMRWNMQHFSSAVTQGILQGESVQDIAKRLKSVVGMNANSAIRAARTATTGAENSGRKSSYKRANELGIDVRKQWMATLDTKTRATHRELDGQKVDVDKPFMVGGNEIDFPGDPDAPPEEVYNCRCTLVGSVAGVDDSDMERWSNLPEGMTYDEWKAGKDLREAGSQQEPSATQQTGGVVEGTDILGSWSRRSDEFDFEIDDVLDAQGFNGLPRVVDANEFDKAVKQANGGNGLIMQRSYSAPDQATLDAYRKQLYDGKWYVDCATGGSQYGQGMYAAADYTGKVTADMQKEMRHYTTLNQGRLGAQPLSDEGKEAYLRRWVGENVAEADRDAAYTYLKFESHTGNVAWADVGKAVEHLGEEKRLSLLESGVHQDVHQMLDGHSYVETMTLDPSAKVITYDELKDEYARAGMDLQRARDRVVSRADYRYYDLGEITKEEYDRLIASQPTLPSDMGSYAASRGYDAINAEGHGASGSYTVVLNRTKLIIRRPK